MSELSVVPSLVDQQTQISFNLTKTTSVTAGIFALSGALVKELTNETMNAGNHTLPADLSALEAGIYLVKVQAGTQWSVQRIVKQ